MTVEARSTKNRNTKPDLYQAISRYMRADLTKALWQILNTLLPYSVLWVLMVITVQEGYPYWITLVLSVLAAGLHVRIFIFFHDCVHGSFFDSPRANKILGYVTGVLTFTPFEQWRRSHAIHHATVGDLDRRGVGDVWTLTVEEYLALSWWKRIVYRIYRNPLVMFVLGPVLVFLIAHRFAHKGSRRGERYSVIITNLALLAIIGVASLTIGFRTYWLIQLPIMFVASSIGVWMFYVQHQYEGGYWARHEDWEPFKAALAGSSYYKLPKVLQWFTGSIGLHHIHHVQPRIPNYNLQNCSDGIPEFDTVEPLSIRGSFHSLRLNLWDENQQRFVSFRSLGTLPQQSQS